MNRLEKIVHRFKGYPTWVLSFAVGKVVKLVGTTGCSFDLMTKEKVIISLKKFHFLGISYFQRAGKIIWTPLDAMTPLSGDPLSGKEDTKKVSSHPTTSCGVQAPFSESYFLIRGGDSQSFEPKI